MTIPYSWGGVFNRDWLFWNLRRCFIHNSLSLSCLCKLQQIYTQEQMNVTFCEPPEAHQFSNTRFWMGRRYLSPAGPLISECCFAQHCIDDRATSARSITTSYSVLFYYEPNISTVVCINLFSLPVVNTQLTEPHVGFLIWEKQHYKHTILYMFTVISVMLLTPLITANTSPAFTATTTAILTYGTLHPLHPPTHTPADTTALDIQDIVTLLPER